MEDRRTMRRFDLKLPCFTRATNLRGDPVQLATRNISSGGAFLMTEMPMPVGTRLTMEIVICRASGSADCASGGCVRLNGEVLRAEASGMAVEFDDQYLIFQVGGRSRTGRRRDLPEASFGRLSIRRPAMATSSAVRIKLV